LDERGERAAFRSIYYYFWGGVVVSYRVVGCRPWTLSIAFPLVGAADLSILLERNLVAHEAAE
jgi:hypothetical protein